MQYLTKGPEDLGHAIAEFRVLRGVTQAELASAAGLNRTYLSNLEQGEVPEYVRRYFALLGHLNLKLTVETT